VNLCLSFFIKILPLIVFLSFAELKKLPLVSKFKSDIFNIRSTDRLSSIFLIKYKIIKNFPLAYETYGVLNKRKNNAILAFHALTGDQFVTNINPITKREGWWTTAVGPGKAIDTNKYFVICANVLGGCMGSYGPKEINPETNKLFGTTFPVITIRDMVKAQKYLLDYLGIKKLLAVTGGSMGGMQVLQFASLYPDKAHSAIPIACSASHSAQNIALNDTTGIGDIFSSTFCCTMLKEKDILWALSFAGGAAQAALESGQIGLEKIPSKGAIESNAYYFYNTIKFKEI